MSSLARRPSPGSPCAERSATSSSLEEPELHRSGDVLVGREAEDAGRLGPGRAPWMTGNPYAACVRAITRDGVSRWSACSASTFAGATSPSRSGRTRHVAGGRSSAERRATRSGSPRPQDHRDADERRRPSRVLRLPSAGAVLGVRRLARSRRAQPLRQDPDRAADRQLRPVERHLHDDEPGDRRRRRQPSLAAADTTVSNATTPALHELTPASRSPARGPPPARPPISATSTSSATPTASTSSTAARSWARPHAADDRLAQAAADDLDVITASTSYLKDLGQGQTGPPQFMFDSAKVTSTESDPAPAKQAATPAPGPAATTPAPRRRPTTLEHATRERPVAAGDPEVVRRSRRPLGQRLAERPLLLDGRARPLRDRRPEADDARRRDRTWCEHLPPRRPDGFGATQLVRIGAGGTQETRPSPR